MKKIASLFLMLHSTFILAEDQGAVELEPVIVTAPLQESLSDSAAPVTVLSDEELRIFADSGAVASNDPGSNLRLSSGICRVR
ncbi:MAG: hypothetical protein ACXW1W_04095, partial [Methylococcaceae bacterium]